MQRREFITLPGGAAATWSVAARAQQAARIRRVAVLMLYAENDGEGQLRARAFRDGLEASGWKIGTDLQIDFRWGVGGLEWIRSTVTASSICLIDQAGVYRCLVLAIRRKAPVKTQKA